MLRELTRTDWLRILGLCPEQIPAAVILRGTRNLRHQYLAYRERFDDVLDVGSPNCIFEDVFIGRSGTLRIGYASVYGAAMASEIVHVFGVLGTRLVLQTGCCGGLADGFEAGDLVVATEAFCGEGAARCYLPDATTVRGTIDADHLASRAAPYGVPAQVGRIYTTAALLAEGEKQIEEWWRAGYAAVDMETATTFAVAEHFGMERTSILFVFDNPRQRHHILLTDAAKDERRERANHAMIDMAFALATEYASR